MRTLLYIQCCLITALFAGCNTASMKTAYQVFDPIYVSKNYFVHQKYTDFHVKRVLFAPITDTTAVQGAAATLNPIFAKEWAKTNQFEIISIPENQWYEFARLNIQSTGKFSKLQLYDFGVRYNVDAVLFTTVTAYHPYEPCTLGISSQLIHTYTGTILWAFNETYDGSMREIEHFAQFYYFKHQSFSHPLQEWHIMLSSMRYFGQMVGFDVAQSLSGTKTSYGMDAHLLKTTAMTEDTIVDINPSDL